MRERQLQFSERLDEIPQSDPLAVIAPAVIALSLRRAKSRDVFAQASAKREMFAADRYIKREPPAIRPAVIGPLADRRKRIAMMAGQMHSRRRSHCQLPGTMPAGSAAQCSAICPGSVNQTRSRCG